MDLVYYTFMFSYNSYLQVQYEWQSVDFNESLNEQALTIKTFIIMHQYQSKRKKRQSVIHLGYAILTSKPLRSVQKYTVCQMQCFKSHCGCES